MVYFFWGDFMKRNYISLLCLFCFIFAFTGCKTQQYPEFVMPEPLLNNATDTGSDNNMEYYSTIGHGLNFIDQSFINLVNEDEFEKWLSSTSNSNSDFTKVSENASLYSFIIHFDIPDETARNIFVKQREFYLSEGLDVEYLTDEEIELLLSKDDKAVADYFVVPNAIAKDGKIYSPKWIYTHSIKDYVKEGLSPELIKEKADKFINDIPFTDEAKNALNEKVNTYALEIK